MNNATFDNIFDIFSVVSGKKGKPHNKRVGRIMATPDEVHVLSDYHGTLSSLDGPMNERKLAHLKSLNGSHSRMISLADIRSGKHPELIAEKEMPTGEAGGSSDNWFKVDRPDLKKPLFIQFKEGKAHMHGQPLGEMETRGILDHHKSGKSKISRHFPNDVTKMENDFKNLAKADRRLEGVPLEGALGAVQAAVDAGHLHPDVLHALHKEIYYDPMVEGVKNKKSFHNEINKPRAPGGVHVMLDGNDFGSINKTHGHAAGDQAIKTMGGAIRSAMDEVVGPEQQDLWRFGGDEFAAHLPSHEHASKFLRVLRNKLEAVPPVGGTHQLSMSAGIGNTHEEADVALNQHAKKAKKEASYLPGQAKMHVHSLVPGHVGTVPHDPEIPTQPPAAPTTPTVKPMEIPKKP